MMLYFYNKDYNAYWEDVCIMYVGMFVYSCLIPRLFDLGLDSGDMQLNFCCSKQSHISTFLNMHPPTCVMSFVKWPVKIQLPIMLKGQINIASIFSVT